ncbi:hypothetical protein [Sedimentimonas flavescens]|uniref:hypothetical protein n=1 Tax=Sedimentimonas flavescens TaxID=2851012 RepID=UPI0021A89684|nr:hypothetical protein [Sedimentimonas flavescens]MCT2539027.1 hypothetical protein [Sedimentimonas flavescens]
MTSRQETVQGTGGDGPNVWLESFFGSYRVSRPAEDHIRSLVKAKGTMWNTSRCKNARINELLFKERAELDDGQCREMYHEV